MLLLPTFDRVLELHSARYEAAWSYTADSHFAEIILPSDRAASKKPDDRGKDQICDSNGK